MKAVRPVTASNGIPYFQMRSVGSHKESGRKKEGKERKCGTARRRKGGRLVHILETEEPREVKNITLCTGIRTRDRTRGNSSDHPTLNKVSILIC